MGAFDLLQALQSAGITIAADAGRLVVRPASKLTDDMRHALRASKSQVLAALTLAAATNDWPPLPPSADRPFKLTKADGDQAHAVAWDDDAIERFTLRKGRALGLGFNADDAGDIAERMHLRDVELDERTACTECAHLRGMRCSNAAAATLATPSVGSLEAVRLKRCQGFAA